MLRDRLLFAALLVAVALPYLPGLSNGFVWLDHLEIVEGRLIAASLGEVPELFLEDKNFEGYHRPVYNLVHSLDRALWGLEPFGFHLSSLLLHLVNVGLLVALARAAGFKLGGALALGGLFGLHPIHTASVGLIHAKADLVSCAALAGTLLLLLRAVRERPPSAGACVAATGLFVVAVLTKEIAFALPVGLALAWLSGMRPRRENAWAFWVVVVTTAGITAGALLKRLEHSSAFASDVGLAERLLTFTTVYVDAVRRLLVPDELFVGDTVTRFGALSRGAQARALTTFALLVGLQLLALRKWASSRPWILTLNLAFVPVMQIVPILHFRADRFLYVPSIGLLGLVVAGAEELVERVPEHVRRRRGPLRPRFALGLVTLLVLFGFSRRTGERVRDFADDETLFRHELALVPDYVEGQTALARALDREGRHAEATPLWLGALEPDAARISYRNMDVIAVNLGTNLLAQGRHEEAYALVGQLEPSIVAEDARQLAAFNRAVAAYRLERYAEALPEFERYAEAHPRDARSRLLLGACAIGVDDALKARAALRAFLELAAPDDPDRSTVEGWLEGL